MIELKDHESGVRELLALLKYPFYPLFNFDNGMNLISKSLTILTSAQLLVVFTFAHIFWRYFVFAGFSPAYRHPKKWRPTGSRPAGPTPLGRPAWAFSSSIGFNLLIIV